GGRPSGGARPHGGRQRGGVFPPEWELTTPTWPGYSKPQIDSRAFIHKRRSSKMAAGERVWDKFLTEQDKAQQAIVGVKPPRAFGQRPALLLIDLYRWVFGDQPEPLLESAKNWPGSCGMKGWEAIPHIQKVLSAAR